MKNVLRIIIGAIFLVSLITLISADNIYPGECNSIIFPNSDNVTFEIISNTSSMEGFTWSKNDTLIRYCVSKDFSPGSFSVKWFNTEEIQVGSGSSVISKSNLEKGITKNLREGQSFYFKILNKHRFRVLNINETSAEIQIESQPRIFTLEVGESYSYCLDNSTLSVTLKDIQLSSYAKLEIKSIPSCKVETIPPGTQPSEDKETPPITNGEEPPIIPLGEPSRLKPLIIILVVIIFVLIIGIIIAAKRRKHGKRKVSKV